MPTARELYERGLVRLVQKGPIAVTTGGVLLLKNNPKRCQVVIVNNENNAAWVTRVPNPQTGVGIRLDPVGGAVTDNLRESGESIQGEWYAILATANGSLYVEEYEVVA